MRRAQFLQIAGCVLLLATGQTLRAASKPEIEAGFRLLYELKFEEARSQFLAWENSHPDDPVGAASEAASYLFEEFYRQGVFTSEFFLDDKKLLDGIEGQPTPKNRAAFLNAIRRAQDLAKQHLKTDPRDIDSLFVLTITTGMLSNYTGLIEKHHFESLKLIRQAEAYANNLLAFQPDAWDAYLALGASNYIIGCLPAYKRFFLSLGGIRSDRGEGMTQLKRAAMGGHYLRPYAKILLALAALREKQTSLARTQLEELVAEFPRNPLFVHELAILKNSTEGSTGP